MDETQDQTKRRQPSGNTGQTAKPLAHLEAQRAKNLRDNLAKRKQQMRARQSPDQDPNSCER
jgi:hypothetical protein